MLMASKDPKKIAMMIIGGKPKETEGGSEKSDYDAAKESAAQKIMSAMESKDASMFAKAFSMMMELCSQESGEEEKEEPKEEDLGLGGY